MSMEGVTAPDPHSDCINMPQLSGSVKFITNILFRSLLLNIWELHVQQHNFSHENLKAILINCSLENGHHYLRALSTGAAGTETESRCVPCDPVRALKKAL